jgi:hypothetical protein
MAFFILIKLQFLLNNIDTYGDMNNWSLYLTVSNCYKNQGLIYTSLSRYGTVFVYVWNASFAFWQMASTKPKSD